MHIMKGVYSHKLSSFDSLEKIAQAIKTAINLSKLYQEDRKITPTEKFEVEFYHPVEKIQQK